MQGFQRPILVCWVFFVWWLFGFWEFFVWLVLVSLFFPWNGLSPPIFCRLKNSEMRKLPSQHQYLSCVLLYSSPPTIIHSLFIPHGGRDSSLWTRLHYFQKWWGRVEKRRERGKEREKGRDREDTWRWVRFPHRLLYKKVHALIYLKPDTGIVRPASCLQS